MNLIPWLKSTATSSFGKRFRFPSLELLEDRVQPAAVVPSFDGTGNNLTHPDWGSAGADLIRVAPAAYSDGVSSPAGADRPSARAISDALAQQPADAAKNSRLMSNFVYAWGQFIDHDLDLTTTASPRIAFNIAVPAGDTRFDPAGTGTQIIPKSRSKTGPATGTSAANPLQQVNDITAWLDGSMVYGSDAARSDALRSFRGGKLKTSDGNLLPLNTAGLANANDTHQTPDNQLFLAGDVRANENIELAAVQTLFVREHNRIAGLIAAANPKLTDEEIFQQARRRVIAEIQAITFNEFLPALLGPAAPGRYQGYNPNVNPGIANEFSAAAFRVGHTLVGDDVEFLDNNGKEIRDALPLRDAFFNPAVLRQTGIDPILKYLASDKSEEVDLHVVDSLRNFLFGAPGAGGFDLAALNIQRGRDHGLADYNTVRAAYGLPRVTNFTGITSDVQVQQALKKLYGDVDHIDLWVGGLAENHLAGASVGPTFARIIADQFERLRDGDRFWYENAFTGADLTSLRSTTLATVIRNNSGLTNLQTDVFFFRASITGRVFADTNGDRVFNRGERPIAGRVVRLLDSDGAVVASTTTHPDGSYRFDGLDLGSYRVQEVLPTGALTTVRSVEITRGVTVVDQNFGEKIATPKLRQLAPHARPHARHASPLDVLAAHGVNVQEALIHHRRV
jgi:peroxidase